MNSKDIETSQEIMDREAEARAAQAPGAPSEVIVLRRVIANRIHSRLKRSIFPGDLRFVWVGPNSIGFSHMPAEDEIERATSGMLVYHEGKGWYIVLGELASDTTGFPYNGVSLTASNAEVVAIGRVYQLLYERHCLRSINYLSRK